MELPHTHAPYARECNILGWVAITKWLSGVTAVGRVDLAVIVLDSLRVIEELPVSAGLPSVGIRLDTEAGYWVRRMGTALLSPPSDSRFAALMSTRFRRRSSACDSNRRSMVRPWWGKITTLAGHCSSRRQTEAPLVACFHSAAGKCQDGNASFKYIR